MLKIEELERKIVEIEVLLILIKNRLKKIKAKQLDRYYQHY